MKIKIKKQNEFDIINNDINKLNELWQVVIQNYNKENTDQCGHKFIAHQFLIKCFHLTNEIENKLRICKNNSGKKLELY